MGQIHNPTCRPLQPSIHLSAFRFLPFVWDECVRLTSESDEEIWVDKPGMGLFEDGYPRIRNSFSDFSGGQRMLFFL
jgi:hypothetical protein